MKRSMGLLLVAAAWLVHCGGGSKEPAAGASSSPVAAELEGDRITEAELDARAKDRLFFRETQGGDPTGVYELREDALESWIEERALAHEAERRGLTVDALLAEEAKARGPVTDADVTAFYQANLQHMQGHPLEDLADDIRRHLEAQRDHEIRGAIVARAKVDVHLEPPRVSVSSDGPAQGPADAPVTLIEFADFQCPFCVRALPLIQTLRERYPTQLRVVFKHMPLEAIHPRARAAAEAAVCADAQGKFWPFHDRLFQSGGALSDADLRNYASALGLDLAAYDACLAAPDHASKIAKDTAEAGKVGISGTPAFVLNGRLIRGLHPPEVLAAMIDKEIAAAGKTP